MPDVKIKKDGQEYGIGVIPQSMYDDVEDLKDAVDNLADDITAVRTKQTTLVTDRVYLIKQDKLRVLRIFNGLAEDFSSITIPSEDRPSALVQGQGFCYDGSSKYVMVVAVNVGADGGVSAYQLQNYNSNSGFEALGTGRKVSCNVLWYVD